MDTIKDISHQTKKPNENETQILILTLKSREKTSKNKGAVFFSSECGGDHSGARVVVWFERKIKYMYVFLLSGLSYRIEGIEEWERVWIIPRAKRN